MKKLGFILILGVAFTSCNQTGLDGLKEQRKTLKDEFKEYSREYTIALNKLDSTINVHPDNKAIVTSINKVPVTITTVQRKTFEHFFEVHGNVEAKENAAIFSQVPGRVVKIHAIEGQQVRKGDVIISLDAAQLESGIKELEKGLELAISVYEKQKKLWEEKIGSELQFLEVKNRKESLEQKLVTLQEQLELYKIRAPFGGVVDEIVPKVGESAAPGFPVARVLNLSRVHLEGAVSEKYINSVKKGGYVDVKFPSLGESVQAKVSRVGSYINPANRTFQVKVEFNNSRGKYKPNQLALMKIRDYKSDDAYVIPARIVQQDRSGQDYVYTFEGDSVKRVKKLELKLGRFYEGDVEVLSGLDSNMVLIDKGSKSVQSEDAIEIIK